MLVLCFTVEQGKKLAAFFLWKKNPHRIACGLVVLALAILYHKDTKPCPQVKH
jgi:hypothetical protein